MGGMFSSPAASDTGRPRVREMGAVALAMNGADPAQAAAAMDANPKLTKSLLRGDTKSLLADGTNLSGTTAGTSSKLGG